MSLCDGIVLVIAQRWVSLTVACFKEPTMKAALIGHDNLSNICMSSVRCGCSRFPNTEKLRPSEIKCMSLAKNQATNFGLLFGRKPLLGCQAYLL